ncbi:MAG: hypothetical protein Q9O24_13140 [Gammaproteobacteria bacterium]|nr:hypothetical protein [Gammaproteobacteria bacterium]
MASLTSISRTSPAPLSMVKLPVPACTVSDRVMTMLSVTSTPMALSAGVTAVTDGAVSSMMKLLVAVSADVARQIGA